MIAFLKVLAEPWLMTEEMLGLILDIAARENVKPQDIQALRKDKGWPADGTQAAYVRENVAVVPVFGPIFPRADEFSDISGATTTDRIALDLAKLEKNPNVQSIILHIDSPGGAVSGISELANIISTVQKPIKAYVGATGASAAYWLAAASNEIVLDKTAYVGSIGAVMAVPTREGAASRKQVEFVSSQSPWKRADPLTESGSRVHQQFIDKLGGLFVNAVLDYRPQLKEADILDLGGKMVVGEDAVKHKLADRTGSLEGLIAEMQEQGRTDMKLGDTKVGRTIAAWLGQDIETMADAPASPLTSGTPAMVPMVQVIDPDLTALLKAERKLRIEAEANAFEQELVAANKGTPALRARMKQEYIIAATHDAEHPAADGQKTGVERVRALADEFCVSIDVLTSEKVPGDVISLKGDPSGAAHDFSKDPTVLHIEGKKRRQAGVK